MLGSLIAESLAHCTQQGNSLVSFCPHLGHQTLHCYYSLFFPVMHIVT